MPRDRTSGAEGEYPVPERCMSYRIWYQGLADSPAERAEAAKIGGPSSGFATGTGYGWSPIPPAPRFPFVSAPQQYAFPLVLQAQVCADPPMIEAKVRGPLSAS